ncbi:hypothetical protein CPB84DRAFT_272556 [Gymnopilus junonius]|uniref:GPI mannosyltransferase 2 n=1 Tax=Gymnopilus junonius TaxID=109634 RepID=A0A9P5NWI1_GYMJU|nr:hypothetical protein CPB84DRAFT_272556 [Gymnopilus junonius]
MTQTIAFGMTFPLYWLLLVMSRSSRGSNGAPEKPIASLITRGEAQGLALGLALGAVLPSAALIIMKDTYATWLWQPYPIFVAIIRAVYSRIVTPTKAKAKATSPEEKENVRKPASKATTGESGSLEIIRTIFLFTFLLSSYIHIRAVWPRVWNGDLSTLYDLLVLTKAPPSDAHPSIQALSFFKWDYALSYSAFSLGLLWSARSFEEVLGMVLCYVVLTPVLGTGAATVFIYGVMCQL